ncbi:hypothetical protein DNL40_16115 [Xylanimonas oleitrophica]|uniref:Uncharacterized protein n=2 Tax=Xylanimonas oleitrophica TaxID=2607479 RepID=A0A2W5WLF9_9MICO|nr:hypothetical protein DNL40_16115 [Xylanimonas oleitrophica]
MSHESCEYCANRLRQAKQIAAHGDLYEGGQASVTILHTYAQDVPTGIWPIDVEVSERASKITTPEGAVAFENEANINKSRVEVGKRDGAWVIVGVVYAPDEMEG